MLGREAAKAGRAPVARPAPSAKAPRPARLFFDSAVLLWMLMCGSSSDLSVWSARAVKGQAYEATGSWLPDLRASVGLVPEHTA